MSHPFDTLPIRQLAARHLQASAENAQLWSSLTSADLQALRERVVQNQSQGVVKAVLLFCRLYFWVALATGLVTAVYWDLAVAVLITLPAALIFGGITAGLRAAIVGPGERVVSMLLPLSQKGVLCEQMVSQVKASAQARAYRNQALAGRHELLVIDHTMADYYAGLDREAELQAARRQLCLDAHAWEPTADCSPASTPN